MNDSLTLEQKKSRRGLLALVGAGGAAAVAALLGRSNGAEAAQYEWSSTNSDATGYFENEGSGHGVKGEASEAGKCGVYGTCVTGIGVEGDSYGGLGVLGSSFIGNGVYGQCYGNGYGVKGESSGGIGVVGFSSGSIGVRGGGKPGVYGYCWRSNGSGVKGEGQAPGTIGLYGVNIPKRRALRTKGRVQMDSIHKKKSLSKKSNLVRLPAAMHAGAEAVVLATMQGNPGNAAVIQRAYRVDTKHIRIQFNKKPARPVSVAYWIVHPD